AKYVMPPVAAGCLLQYVYCMYVNIEQYEKKTVGMAFASITAALVNYVLNAVFIRAYGYVAAAYTTYVGYFVLLCMHVIFVRRMGMAHVYRNRIILGVSISVSIIMFLFSFILDQDIIRYILLFAYAVLMTTMLWKNRAAIMQFIRR
ncbi:MAG: polysaccharide biosynthesis C-terminal domain-containing protein, partial [Clostridia bacterium]|nr:polysaccharide biosynthesis C-terminal domain-containing protein [Clostridia bacterium]